MTDACAHAIFVVSMQQRLLVECSSDMHAPVMILLPYTPIHPAGARRPPPPGQRKYYRYHMQRLQTTANHVLFYVVDAANVATLAVVVSTVCAFHQLTLLSR